MGPPVYPVKKLTDFPLELLHSPSTLKWRSLNLESFTSPIEARMSARVMAGQMLAVQPYGPEFGSPPPTEKTSCVCLYL